jgi:hypothetical protein
MSPSSSVELADAVSNLLYALAGWLLVGLGGLGVVVPVLAFARGAASNPVVPAIIVLLSLCMVAFGVFVNPGFRRRLDRRHSTRTFGRQRTVEHRTFRAEEDRTERCVACDTRTDRGELRRYRTEFCLAGLPFYTTTEGENAYCLDCAADDAPEAESTTVQRERAEPLTES